PGLPQQGRGGGAAERGRGARARRRDAPVAPPVARGAARAPAHHSGEPVGMATATFRIWRGDASGGAFHDYRTEISEGMVVLDAVHRVQAEQAPDLACRWNCKAGKCGSGSAEMHGRARLLWMTRPNPPPPRPPG